MAGTLILDTIKSSTTSPPTIQNVNGTQIGTLCRAWVMFNGTGTVAINNSFNVSSITDVGTGDYTLNFTNAMPSSNYAGVAISVGAASGLSCMTDNGKTTSTYAIRAVSLNAGVATLVDVSIANVAVFS